MVGSSLLAYDDEQIGNGPDAIGPNTATWIDQYEGESGDQVAAKLEQVGPYPAARNVMDAGPQKRWRAVAEVKYGN